MPHTRNAQIVTTFTDKDKQMEQNKVIFKSLPCKRRPKLASLDKMQIKPNLDFTNKGPKLPTDFAQLKGSTSTRSNVIVLLV